MKNINETSPKDSILTVGAKAYVEVLLTAESQAIADEAIEALGDLGHRNIYAPVVIQRVFVEEYSTKIASTCVRAFRDNNPKEAEGAIRGMLHDWDELHKALFLK